MTLTPELHEQYQMLWDTCIPHDPEASAIAARLIASRARYEDVTAVTNPAMPWHFVALVHQMECSQRWDCHLHNGDPLTARTVHVPINRPLYGDPPYQWEASACDALSMQGLGVASLDWTIPGELYHLERYNGFGYRAHGVLTPYLWAGSNHYTAGKFTADGRFDAAAVSKQIGAAVVLKRILESASGAVF
jgi:lysozyme family protein